MDKRILALLAAAALVLQAGWVMAASTPEAAAYTTTNVFAVNKTGKNIFLVVDQEGNDSYQAVKYIPAKVAGHVSINSRAWFHAYTNYDYKARLFKEKEEAPFCTVQFAVGNNYGPSPTVVDIVIKQITGTCTASVMINDHARNTSCQVSITAN